MCVPLLLQISTYKKLLSFYYDRVVENGDKIIKMHVK